MASFSSSSTKKISPASAYTLKLAWSGEQDIVTNTSTITVIGTVSRNGTSYKAKNLNGGSKNTVKIDEVTYNPTTKYNLFDYTSKEIFSYTQVVEHDLDGSKTLDLLWSFDGNTGSATANPSGTITASIELPVIHRASSISVSDGNFGDEITITIESKNEEFTHDLEYSFYDITGTIEYGVKENCNFVVPLCWLRKIPNDTFSKDCVITCTTKYQGTIIGTSTYTNLLLNVPNDVKPVIHDFKVVRNENNEGVSGFVQNKTAASVVLNCDGSYGSTIKSTTITLNGNKIEDLEMINLSQSETNKLFVKVVDSRGHFSEKDYVFEVKPYKDPILSSFTVVRCIKDGLDYIENDEEGTVAKVSIISEVTPDINDGAIQLIVKYKKKTEASWSEEIVLEYGKTCIAYLEGFSLDSSYDFQVVLSDVFESIDSGCSLSSTHMLIDIHDSGHGVAIGKSSENQDILEVGYPLDMNGNEIRNAKIQGLLDWVYPVGSIYTSTKFISPEELFGGTWKQLSGRFLFACNDDFVAGSVGGEANSTLTVDNLPSHAHDSGSLTISNIELKGSWENKNARFPGLNSFTGVVKEIEKSIAGYWDETGGTDANTVGFEVDASHSHELSGKTELTGNGIEFSNMPPYLAVYMWERIE